MGGHICVEVITSYNQHKTLHVVQIIGQAFWRWELPERRGDHYFAYQIQDLCHVHNDVHYQKRNTDYMNAQKRQNHQEWTTSSPYQIFWYG